jgi:hypothetical protein
MDDRAQYTLVAANAGDTEQRVVPDRGKLCRGAA